jgi:outer membrane lipoprotein carrier protein
MAVAVASFAGGEAPPTQFTEFQKRYAEVRDLSARFVQHSLVAALAREETSRGRLLYQRPGRFRWEVESPEAHVLVTDGEVLRMFSPQDRIIQIAPLSAGALSQTALGVLFGEVELESMFEVERIEKPTGEEAVTEDRTWLRLHPRKDAAFERMEVLLDPKTLDVRELLILDLLGNRTHLRLEAVELNVGLKEDTFTIRVPDDTEVIDLR